MYACLHHPTSTGLLDLASSFAPDLELTIQTTILFPVNGLRRLIGNPHQIAAEIARRGAEHGIIANLAIAANPDSAVLAATNFPGVTVIPPGQELSWLGKISLDRVSMPEELLETLKGWGLHTLEDVAGLPPVGLLERLGNDGLRLYNLAWGRTERPLRLIPPATSYRERIDLEYPLSQLEPLLFVISRLLHELCDRLKSNSIGTNRITTELQLENKTAYTRILELPVPQCQTNSLLKLIQLDLEAHPPSAAVTAVILSVNPSTSRKLQNGLFIPQGPEPPVKLQLTLARISALAGGGNAGSLELLNTHRPDAFRIHTLPPASSKPHPPETSEVRLALSIFRPALPAKVRTVEQEPRHVAAFSVTGNVIEAAGPWRTSGDWWTPTAWSRDEWDVALSDGGLYRIWQATVKGEPEWYIEGVYD